MGAPGGGALSALLDREAPRCIFCGREGSLVSPVLCARCQKLFPEYAGERETAGLRLYAAFYYDGVRERVLAAKFGADMRFLSGMGEAVAYMLYARGAEAQGVTFLPLHAERLRERGYDQAELMAQTVAKRLHLPLVYTLERRINTRAQSELSPREREKNVAGAFALRPGGESAGERLILIDDVVTTGATLRAALRALPEDLTVIPACFCVAGGK